MIKVTVRHVDEDEGHLLCEVPAREVPEVIQLVKELPGEIYAFNRDDCKFGGVQLDVDRGVVDIYVRHGA